MLLEHTTLWHFLRPFSVGKVISCLHYFIYFVVSLYAKITKNSMSYILEWFQILQIITSIIADRLALIELYPKLEFIQWKKMLVSNSIGTCYRTQNFFVIFGITLICSSWYQNRHSSSYQTLLWNFIFLFSDNRRLYLSKSRVVIIISWDLKIAKNLLITNLLNT